MDGGRKKKDERFNKIKFTFSPIKKIAEFEIKFTKFIKISN